MVCWAAGSEGLVSFDEGSILTTSFRAAFSTCNPQRQWGRGLSRRVSLGAPGGREGGLLSPGGYNGDGSSEEGGEAGHHFAFRASCPCPQCGRSFGDLLRVSPGPRVFVPIDRSSPDHMATSFYGNEVNYS